MCPITIKSINKCYDPFSCIILNLNISNQSKKGGKFYIVENFFYVAFSTTQCCDFSHIFLIPRKKTWPSCKILLFVYFPWIRLGKFFKTVCFQLWKTGQPLFGHQKQISDAEAEWDLQTLIIVDKCLHKLFFVTSLILKSTVLYFTIFYTPRRTVGFTNRRSLKLTAQKT